MTQTSGGTCDVVVCCYNHGAYIEKAIGSVLGQDSARLGTIFVCDDASPDNTAEVVARVKATSDLGHKIQWHGRLVNAGPAINFREGVMRVTSPYIAFLDGDDYWSHPSKLTHQLALLDSEPQMVYCGHEYVFMEEDGSLHGVFPQTQRPEYVRRRLPNLGEIEQIIVNPDLLFTENTCGFHMNAVVGHSAILQQTLLPEWDDLKVGDWPWFWLTSELGEVGLIKARWANNIKHQGSAFNEFMAAKKNHLYYSDAVAAGAQPEYP